MNDKRNTLSEMRTFLLLWGTQMISGLGSAMTSYALVIWSYTQKGSALVTAMLMVCTYAPYVLFSVFAGAFSDRWDKKKILLGCDTLAALCTLAVLILLKAGQLRIWHLYLINTVTGLMNSIQQPASEVTVTAILPRKHYQKVGSMRYLSSSVNSILTPILTTAVMGLVGMNAVIVIDLCSFAVAFVVLLWFIPIPDAGKGTSQGQNLLESAWEGIRWLRGNPGIFHLMLFLAAINLVAAMYQAAFPAMALSRANGGEAAMGAVNTVTGLTTLIGSLLASACKPPRSRVRAIWLCLMLSMGTENLLLSLGRSVTVWCIGVFLGWITIPLMSTNLEAVFRLTIPEEIQGRVFAARNTFQFFTIPVGYFLGGLLVEWLFEPFMAGRGAATIAGCLFETGKGSGAACFFSVLWVMGIGVCLLFRRDRAIWNMEDYTWNEENRNE